MDFTEKFKDILNDNEKIIKVYKPNKLKYWLFKAVQLFIMILFFALVVMVFSTMQVSDGTENVEPAFNPTGFGVSLGIVLALWLFTLIYAIFFYRNLYYCVTNERVIIRRGVFGTDFQTLDMHMIGAVNVHVSLLDKIARKNTGSIVFGSTSAPIFAQSASFMFRDIVAPYDESKEIKTAVDNLKQVSQKQNDKEKE